MSNYSKQEKIKLQVSVSVELCERIDVLAREIGMDRSQLCAYFIGRQVKQEELQSDAIASVLSQFSPAMVEVLKDSFLQGQVVKTVEKEVESE
jgi:hypothetical protein